MVAAVAVVVVDVVAVIEIAARAVLVIVGVTVSSSGRFATTFQMLVLNLACA